jgi:monothiol glutaredoxin
MHRSILAEAQVHPAMRAGIANDQADSVKAVQAVAAANDLVVVRLRQNPFPQQAGKLLHADGLACKYLECGGYFSEWRCRLALKIWRAARAAGILPGRVAKLGNSICMTATPGVHLRV